jgi:6-phosphogluconolactonase
MASPAEIRILNDAAELFKAAAAEFSLTAANAVHRKGSFSVALSGGSTPKGLYSLLASKRGPAVPWAETSIFFSDERFVPPDDPESNFRMAKETLLSKVSVPAANIFRLKTEESDPDRVASQYQTVIENHFASSRGAVPVFDLILLGLGPDGHTASLFPGSAALDEKKRLVVSNWVEKFKTYRLTFTYPIINRAACVMFLVSGNDKAEIVREVFEHPEARVPAQGVNPTSGQLLWLMDRDAASELAAKKN